MAFQNLAAWTEVDPGNDITLGATQISWVTLARASDSYAYDDFGIDNFSDDVNMQFECQFSNKVGVGKVPGMFILANIIGHSDFIATTDDCVRIQITTTPTMVLSAWRNGSQRDANGSVALSYGVTYYCTFNRDETIGANGRYTLTIRTGSHTGAVIDVVICDPDTKIDYRYIYTASMEDAASGTIDGFFQNLDIAVPLASGPANVSKIAGIDKANVSLINTVDIATIAKINGVA
jgi:hypothetical protein